MPIFGWVGAPVGAAVMLLVTAGALLFVFRFFYASELSFKQSLAVVSWVLFAVGLVTTPLLLMVLGLKGDWNLNPQEVLQANLGLLLDKATAAKPLWALAHQHRPLLALDRVPARDGLCGRQPQEDGCRGLGRRDPLGR